MRQLWGSFWRTTLIFVKNVFHFHFQAFTKVIFFSCFLWFFISLRELFNKSRVLKNLDRQNFDFRISSQLTYRTTQYIRQSCERKWFIEKANLVFYINTKSLFMIYLTIKEYLKIWSFIFKKSFFNTDRFT